MNFELIVGTCRLIALCAGFYDCKQCIALLNELLNTARNLKAMCYYNYMEQWGLRKDFKKL